MRKKLFDAAMAVLMLFALCVPGGFAANAKAIPIRFHKAGGGQFIYCNNPEAVTKTELSSTDNPSPTYLMKNEDLGPDNYSVFFCFYNFAGFDIEPDVEFTSENGAVIKINSIGYYTPQGVEFWDCLGAWPDYLGVNIRSLAGNEQHVAFAGAKNVPAEFSLYSGENDWASRYLYNYEALKPEATFNMLIDFTIVSGRADVNFAALKHTKTLGDRSSHDPNAAPGKYVRDNTVKGIDKETLPIVETDIQISIDKDTPNGEPVPAEVFNQYHPEGNVTPFWTTNINPSRDEYMVSKNTAAGSDMLSLTYEDDSKLAYYGRSVPQSQRDNVWQMDLYHFDTAGYDPSLPWTADEHVPNAFTSETLDKNNPPNPNFQFNLGNFGVTNRYRLAIENRDSIPRTLNYYIKSSCTSNIVIARDKDGTMLNPFTLEPENTFAISKEITWGEQTDACMFSAEVGPGETKEYVLDVILPTNNFGGQANSIRIDTVKHLQPREYSPFPSYMQTQTNKDVFFTGAETMKWENGALLRFDEDAAVWNEVILPETTRTLFEAESNHISLVKTGAGYAARFCGWDDFGNSIMNKNRKNTVYFLDGSMNVTGQKTFPDYIFGFLSDGKTLYVQSDKAYRTDNLETFEPVEETPVWNGKYLLVKKGSTFYERKEEKDIPIVFEGETPKEIFSTDGVFYYKKSWQTSLTDKNTENILSVSPDGVNWTDIALPSNFLELLKVSRVGDRLFVSTKFEQFSFDVPTQAGLVRVQLNGELLSFLTQSKISQDRTMVPIRLFFEKLGASVGWNGATGTVSAEKGGRSIELNIGSKTAFADGVAVEMDVAPYIENDKTMVPMRFISEQLGCTVDWDENTKTAAVDAIF